MKNRLVRINRFRSLARSYAAAAAAYDKQADELEEETTKVQYDLTVVKTCYGTLPLDQAEAEFAKRIGDDAKVLIRTWEEV